MPWQSNGVKMRIETFNDLYDATQFIEVEAEYYDEYFKVELIKLEDGRWRVGITYERQMELDV